MKLKDLKESLKSHEGDVKFGVLYNKAQRKRHSTKVLWTTSYRNMEKVPSLEFTHQMI